MDGVVADLRLDTRLDVLKGFECRVTSTHEPLPDEIEAMLVMLQNVRLLMFDACEQHTYPFCSLGLTAIQEAVV